jgi:L-fuconolactonase
VASTEYGPIFRSFEEGDLQPHLDECGVDGTVLVQSMDSYEDTDYMLEVAGRWPRVRARGRLGAVGPRPRGGDRLDRYQQDPRFVGVRHLIHEDPDPDWLLRPDVGEGLALLAACGLTFDVVAVLPRHLEHVPVLAARYPDLRLVIDHLAKPPIKDKGWEPWPG